MIDQTISIGEIVSSVLAFSAVGALVWNMVGRPNVKQDQEIALIKQTQDNGEKTHDVLRRGLSALGVQMDVVLTNHLPHIQIEMTEIKTILNERLPKKK